ncbi:hypothetical protein D3C87_466190 [compost metagenome]
MHIIKRLNKHVAKSNFDSAVHSYLYKVNKSSSIQKILDEVASMHNVGYLCSHEHDCCGCWIHRIDSFQRTKPNEFYVQLSSVRNV